MKLNGCAGHFMFHRFFFFFFFVCSFLVLSLIFEENIFQQCLLACVNINDMGVHSDQSPLCPCHEGIWVFGTSKWCILLKERICS